MSPEKPTVLIATTNAGKQTELTVMLGELAKQIHWKTLADLPHLPPIPEDGSTFTENARKKALGYAKAAGLLTLADDSGLVIDALDSRPMREAGTKRLVVIDACLSCSTHFTSTGQYDMAWIFGAYNYQSHLPLADQMNYIGWSIKVDASGGTIFEDDTTDRIVDFWKVLGSGNNLALAYERIWNNSATASASATLLPTFFGPDELNQYGKDDDQFKREGCGIKEQKIKNQ